MENTSSQSSFYFTKKIALFVAICLILSTIYNWAYFEVIDFPVVFSFADCLSTAWLFSPVVAFILGVIALFDFLLVSYRKPTSESTQKIESRYFIYIPVVLFLFALLGFSNAMKAKSSHKVSHVYLKDEKFEGTLVRSLEKGVLLASILISFLSLLLCNSRKIAVLFLITFYFSINSGSIFTKSSCNF